MARMRSADPAGRICLANAANVPEGPASIYNPFGGCLRVKRFAESNRLSYDIPEKVRLYIGLSLSGRTGDVRYKRSPD